MDDITIATGSLIVSAAALGLSIWTWISAGRNRTHERHLQLLRSRTDIVRAALEQKEALEACLEVARQAVEVIPDDLETRVQAVIAHNEEFIARVQKMIGELEEMDLTQPLVSNALEVKVAHMLGNMQLFVVRCTQAQGLYRGLLKAAEAEAKKTKKRTA